MNIRATLKTLLMVTATLSLFVGCANHKETAQSCTADAQCLSGQYCGTNGFCYDDVPFYNECVDYLTATCENLIGCDEFYSNTLQGCVDDNLYSGFCDYGFNGFDSVEWSYCSQDLIDNCYYDSFDEVVISPECDNVYW